MHSSESSERSANNACRNFSGGLVAGMILVFSSFYLNGDSSFFSSRGKGSEGKSSKSSSAGGDTHAAGLPVDGAACAAASLLRYQELKERARVGRFAGTPMLLDILHSEDQCRNVPGVIPPSYTDRDICYLITVEDHSLYWMRTLNKTWFKQVPWENIFAIGHTDDPTLRMTSNEKYKSSNNAWGTRHDALFEKFYLPETAHCKWWLTISDKDQVNPKALLDMLYGLHYTHPYSIGYIWHDMGWSHGVTYAGPHSVLSRAALEPVLKPSIWDDLTGDHCMNRTSSLWKGVNDDFGMDACLWDTGTIHVHSMLFEPIGELGPGGSWSWQQPHHLMNWVACRNENNPPRAFSIFSIYYYEIYGENQRAQGRGAFKLVTNLTDPIPMIRRQLLEEEEAAAAKAMKDEWEKERSAALERAWKAIKRGSI
jgi:hypothetical protein